MLYAVFIIMNIQKLQMMVFLLFTLFVVLCVKVETQKGYIAKNLKYFVYQRSDDFF